MSLEDAIVKARAELEQLKAEEDGLRQTTGVTSTLVALTESNQRLTEQRTQVRERIDQLEADLVAVREYRGELELQLKGARARVQKLKERR